jgi:hypothetical protein
MKLDKIPKKNIYEVPADYFDKLPGVMMNRVQGRNQETRSAFFIFGQLPWLKHALAGFALLITFVFIYLTNSQAPEFKAEDSSHILASVSKNEAMEYLITSDQLENADLALLPHADQDFTHEFIQASKEEIMSEVELADLNDITDN